MSPPSRSHSETSSRLKVFLATQPKYGYAVFGNRLQRLLDNPHDQNDAPTNLFPQSFVEDGAYSATTKRFGAGQGGSSCNADQIS